LHLFFLSSSINIFLLISFPLASKSLESNQNGTHSTKTGRRQQLLNVTEQVSEQMLSIHHADLELTDQLLRGISESGYEMPTIIQKRALLPCIQGKSMVILAPPNAGKRVAFCIAMLHSVNDHLMKCQVLIIAPTHAVALEIAQILRKLGAYLNISIHACIGGENRRDDRIALQNGCQIVVGTFGRLHDLLISKWLVLTYTKAFVLDGSHKLWDGVTDSLREILRQLPENAQRIFTTTGDTQYINEYISNYFVVSINRPHIKNDKMMQIKETSDVEPFSFDLATQIADLRTLLHVTEVTNSSNDKNG
jgi:translation initiation factor 4A